ncbi:putative apoptotic chromatin condensation inducer in the nucleus-like [Abeliophyllum distichum]|uniref:Apoptotic chromatin condensation inducer in the nucleus-like n=1 Tax=Abeliophyllum distichum TaxID=126358 RepID=A0ABD1STY1_9LAMI
MSTQYPVLDNRPINKWKVTELKEELKRRNLKITGLKDDLVRRLDEAIQNEWATLDTQKGENLDHKSEPFDSNSTVNDTVAAQPTSAEGAHESNKLEEDEITKSSQNDAVLVGESRDLEASMESSGISIVAVGNMVMSSEQRLDDSDITMDNEVLKSSSKEALENNKVDKGTEVLMHGKKDDVLVEEPGAVEASVQSIGIFPVAVSAQITSSDTTLQDTNTKVDSDDIGVSPVPSGKKSPENQDSEVEKEVFKPLQMDAECDVSYSSSQLHDVFYPSNQVHEVSANIEFQVKSESISTDTLSFNEKKELKDNLNADNVQLEPEVVRPELVQPSSSENLSHDGSFHRLDDGMPGGNQGSFGETDDEKSRNMEVSQKNVNAEIDTSDNVGEDNKLTHVTITKYSSPVHAAEPERLESSAEEKSGFADSAKEGNPQDNKSPDFDFGKMAKLPDGDHLEKINLEQSSADDSMEEDVLEARQLGSDQNAAEVSKKAEPMDESDKLEPFHENNDKIASLSDKRRFQEAADENAPPKRQRRWNGENVKLPVQQSSGVSVTTTPNNLFQAVSEKSNVAASDSSLDEDAPKERIVPPSAKRPTNSLRIDNFLRPFTLKAVQELLAKTGKVCNFWMDQIKTHCYVTYSTVEDSIETRNAVYNLQWPTNGGRLLTADFVDPEEVKQRIEAPSQSAISPVSTSPSVVPIQTPSQPLQPREQGPNKQSEPRHPLSRELPASGASRLHERLSQAPSTVEEEVDPPIVTLDDLFRKTQATPRIYYLPLTEEQVAAKVQKRE